MYRLLLLFSFYSFCYCNWVQTNKFVASDGAASSQFGHTLALIDSTIAVGAYGSNSFRGSAYIYNLSDISGSERKVMASDGVANTYFSNCQIGLSVNTFVTGARGADINGTDSGAIYSYDISSSTPQNTEEKWYPPDHAAYDRLCGASLLEDRLVVGAYGKTELVPNAGAVYILNSSNLQSSVTKLVGNPNKQGNFGFSISQYGDHLVVGASGTYTGINGEVFFFNISSLDPQSTNKTLVGPSTLDFGRFVSIYGDILAVSNHIEDTNKGKVYIYDLGSATPEVHQYTLQASDGLSNYYFGFGVQLYKNTLVVGSANYNGNQGKVYLYDLSDPDPQSTEIQVVANDSLLGDQFGASFSIEDITLVVGANNVNSGTGAAYIFEHQCPFGEYAPTPGFCKDCIGIVENPITCIPCSPGEYSPISGVCQECNGTVINGTTCIPITIANCSMVDCGDHGICVANSERAVCSCFSGYAGEFCTSKIGQSFCPNGERFTAEPLVVDYLPFIDPNETESSLVGGFLELDILSPLVLNRFETSIEFVGSLDDSCSYPLGMYWIKELNKFTCEESWSLSIPWEHVASTCGFLSSTTSNEEFFYGTMVISMIEEIQLEKRQSVLRTVTNTFNVEVSFPSFINVTSSNVEITAAPALGISAAITESGYETTLSKGYFELYTVVQWPYQLNSVAIIPDLNSTGVIIESITELPNQCSNQEDSTCSQRFEVILDPGMECVLDGDYDLEFNSTCRGTTSYCSFINPETAFITATLSSSDFCGAVRFDIDASAVLLTYSDSLRTLPSEEFELGETAYLRAEITVIDNSVELFSTTIRTATATVSSTTYSLVENGVAMTGPPLLNGTDVVLTNSGLPNAADMELNMLFQTGIVTFNLELELTFVGNSKKSVVKKELQSLHITTTHVYLADTTDENSTPYVSTGQRITSLLF